MDCVMKCLEPIYLKKTKQMVPCGKCYACLTNKRLAWAYRLQLELKYSVSAAFVTLTYDQLSLPSDGFVNKKDIQAFIQSLRLANRNIKFKYYCVGEYGEQFGRPHYHLVLFSDSNYEFRSIWRYWKYGNVDVGSVTDSSINYILKYHVTPKWFRGHDVEYHGFCLMSKGLGSQIVDDMRRLGYVNRLTINGKNFITPRYYRKKLDVQSDTCMSVFDYFKHKFPSWSDDRINLHIMQLRDFQKKKLKLQRKNRFN